MKIVADQNIPLVHELFSDIGEITRLPGRDMQAADVKDADVLLVRSITSVNETLLKGSRVKFVGSCTIGMDHIDVQYLNRRNIAWANAPGCNANAVVQYVMSAMAAVRPDWKKLTVGIIGCGNIGGRLYHCLENLKVNIISYDPFLSGDVGKNLVSFDQVLQADIITCHTPLTTDGPFPTYHLFDKHQLAKLSPNTVLINSGRGPVIDNHALLTELNRRPFSVVLDVWENEPMIDLQLLEKVTLGTPHIAGYSVEGKEQGSFMVYQALCDFLNRRPNQEKNNLLSIDQSIASIDVDNEFDSLASFENLNQLLLACYDIRQDDKVLRKNVSSTGFDTLRKNYLSRREYTHFQLPDKLKQSPLQNTFNIIKGVNG